MEEYHKLLTDSVDESIIRHNVSKPLPLGGPPCQVTIQSGFFFNKDLKYLRYGSKGGRPSLSISKMKAAYYPDVGLKQMVPDQMWIKEECKHTSKGDRRAVRTHMRILSVVRIKVFSMYGDKYRVQMIMRFNEIHKFSDDTLHQIDEALDFWVKEFKVNRMNSGLNTRAATSATVSALYCFEQVCFPYYRHIYTPSFKTLDMAALYILDKLSEAVGSAILKDKMKVVFSQAWESDQDFIDVLCDLCSALRVSIMKDQRLVAELEALGQRADTLKPLEYMRETVARDSARVGVLEQLLVGAHVGMNLKAGYVAAMKETW
nr:hypothetical protein [Tanacetum cinerariifolium]